MKPFIKTLPPFLDQKEKGQILNGACIDVCTYTDLIETVAKLNNECNNSLLLFRGQNNDYINKNSKTMLLPSILRAPEGNNLSFTELKRRIQLLQQAEQLLLEKWYGKRFPYYNRLKHWKMMRWAILQHYEVSETPLLDLTQSLRVACSFGCNDNKNDYFYIYVLAMPYYTGRVSINSEEQIAMIRLMSLCPHIAKRPFHQEGILVGDDFFECEEMMKAKNMREINKSKYDFEQRLVVKFRLPNTKEFWQDIESPISSKLLYPQNDEVYELCEEIKTTINQN